MSNAVLQSSAEKVSIALALEEPRWSPLLWQTSSHAGLKAAGSGVVAVCLMLDGNFLVT